jgi:hypothetical protein
MTTVANFATVTFYGGCVWETFGSAGFFGSSPVCEPAHSCHPFVSQQKGGTSFSLEELILMSANNPPRRFTPMSQLATDYPVLLIDSAAPIRELHNCLSERLNAVLKYLNLTACTSLPDYAENDINTVTNIARILIQDVSDVFRVIEQRGFDAPKG